MNATAIRFCTALLAACAAAGARAEYRCDAPPSAIDQRACKAAEQGPEALRHFIQRLRMIHHLEFSDYVNEATVLAWEAREARQRDSASEDRPPAAAVVAGERR